MSQILNKKFTSSSLVFLLLFLVMLILSLLTPMVSDDFAYCFSWADWTRIHHIGQIIPSMSVHREITNGRVFVHGLVQILLLLPRPVYCLLNALNLTFLFHLMKKLFKLSGSTQETVTLIFSIFFLFSFTPAFGENYLWLDGSVNYSWGLTSALLFLYPFLCSNLALSYPRRKIVLFLWIVHSFFLGTWSENTSLISIFLAICLCLSACLMNHRKPTVWEFAWIAAACAGYLYLMTAPATSGRAGASEIAVLGYNFRMIFHAANSALVWPLMIYAVCLALSLCFHVDKNMILISVFLLFGSALSLLSYVFAAYFVPRHMCTSVFLLMAASSFLISGLCRCRHAAVSAVALAVVSVLFILQFPVGCLDVAISYHKQQLREAQITEAVNSGETAVVLENYYPYSSYAVPFELNTTDPSVGPNINIADYYGLDSVLGIDPQEGN